MFRGRSVSFPLSLLLPPCAVRPARVPGFLSSRESDRSAVLANLPFCRSAVSAPFTGRQAEDDDGNPPRPRHITAIDGQKTQRLFFKAIKAPKISNSHWVSKIACAANGFKAEFLAGLCGCRILLFSSTCPPCRCFGRMGRRVLAVPRPGYIREVRLGIWHTTMPSILIYIKS